MRTMESGLADYSTVYNREFAKRAREKAARREREEQKIRRERERARRENLAAESARFEADRRMREMQEMLRQSRRYSMAMIEARIRRVFKISKQEMRSHRRSHYIIFPRHAFFYWAARMTSRSLPEIGRYLGGMDHSTVLNGIKQHVKRRKAMGRTLRPIARGEARTRGRTGADK